MQTESLIVISFLVAAAMAGPAQKRRPEAPLERGAGGSESDVSRLRQQMRQLQKKLNSQGVAIKFLEDGWMTFGRYRVWFSLFPLSWHSADQYCRSKNARLASGAIKSPTSRKQVYGYAKNQGTDYWIGLNDLDREGHYVWSDGGTLSPTSHLWARGEPNNYNNNQDCGMIWGIMNALDDTSCFYETRFICEIAI